ncbi:hypothetical protein, partial [Pseudomonas fluorescens]|uniref:hypothetical protein n=1 Tax=Pseudomonas fluorescens TaxID=294 RepID=UPI001E4DF2A9
IQGSREGFQNLWNPRKTRLLAGFFVLAFRRIPPNLMDTSRKPPRFSRAIVRPARPILHQQACTQISDELGHGRLDVVSAYNDDRARAKQSTWRCSWRIFSPGRMPFANVTYAKQGPFKRRFLIACTKIIHGPGSESIPHGF